MSRAKQTETLPGVLCSAALTTGEALLPALPSQNLENGKAKAEKPAQLGTPAYTGYDAPCDEYAVLVVRRFPNGTLSRRGTPDFVPGNFDVKAGRGENAASGGLGAWQAMCDRAALFAKQGWCAWAGVVRRRGNLVWHVTLGGYVSEWKEAENNAV